MSSRVFIQCDRCGRLDTACCSRDKYKVRALRHLLKQVGWRSTCNGRDYCPDCEDDTKPTDLDRGN